MGNESGTSLTLLQRIRDGDASAWGRVVDLYAPLVHHWFRRWGAAAADIDDLTQETFQAAAQSIHAFRREQAGDTFRGWLRAIARHKLLAFWRARSQDAAGVGGSEALQRLREFPDRGTDDEPEDSSEISALFHRALGLIRAEFEPRTWQAFWRVTVDGLSAADAGAEAGLSPSAVRMAKSRVLRRLREGLGDLAP
jgi:RNA polymerase sigma-70 factor (ECF subfamily)